MTATTSRWSGHGYNRAGSDRRAGTATEALSGWVAVLEREVGAHPARRFNFYDVWNPHGA